MQRLPHPPQLLPSEVRSAQARMQSTSLPGHWQLPPTHDAPMSQRLPQPPQLVFDVCGSTHRPAPPQEISPVGQPMVQTPAEHMFPGPQRSPHPPQLFGSVVVSTH
jgi:hypothetical protein